jgi:hypothetical protein
MKKIEQFDLGDGKAIFVEVHEVSGSGFDLVSSGPDKVGQTFEQALEAVRPAVDRIRRTLTNLNNPSEIELSFGIVIAGGVGAVFSSVSTEANFAVKLTWHNE